MTIRAVLSTISIMLVWKYLQVMNSGTGEYEIKLPLFLTITFVGSVFFKSLAKMTYGSFVIVLTIFIFCFVGEWLYNHGFESKYQNIELAPVFAIFFGLFLLAIGLHSTSFFRIWEMLGALTIFIIMDYLFFYHLDSLVQGAGVLFGGITMVAWLLGIIITNVVFYFYLKRNQPSDADLQKMVL